MILPQAAVSIPPAPLNVLGTGSTNLAMDGTPADSLFASLFAAIGSDLSSSAANGLTGEAGTKAGGSSTAPTGKSGSGSDDQDQKNAAAAAPVTTGATVTDPLLLGLFCFAPAQPVTSDSTTTNTSPEEQNSGPIGGAAPVRAPATSEQMNSDQANLQTMLQPIVPYVSALAAQQGSPVETNTSGLQDQSSVPEMAASVLNTPSIGNDNSAPATNNAATQIQADGSATAPASGSKVNGPSALEPVFTLAIRPQPGTQGIAEPQPAAKTSAVIAQSQGPASATVPSDAAQVDAAQPASDAQMPAPQSSNGQQGLVSPQAPDLQSPAANIRPSNMSGALQPAPAAVSNAAQQNANAAPSNINNALTSVSSQNNAQNDGSQSSLTVTSTPAITKNSALGSNSDSKPGDGQTGEKQAAPVPFEPAISAGAANASQPQFNAPHAQPVTEYVNPQNTTETHANGAVTDLRLHIDGAANQQVNVRVMQQADGLRLSVHSNDPALAQSLRDHAPELTAKLEQHHYEAEMLLPKGGDSQLLNPANTRANLQQDFSGRQQGSGGQGNPQNKQDQQERKQPENEDKNFSTLLQLRS